MGDKTTRELLELLLEAQASEDWETLREINRELRTRIPDGAIYAIARPGYVYLSGWIYPILRWEDLDT